ncbi:MAG: hypothetical protein PHG20_00150 [Geobacteraceae bacterium]|nr:hypothetical protein [Geobacteraceae bacterium]
MTLAARVKRLEAKKGDIDYVQVCKDVARILIAWEDDTPWESFSGELAPQSIAALGYDAGGEKWRADRAESIAVYEKTFGPGSYAENRRSVGREEFLP